MAKIYSEWMILEFAKSFSECISDFTVARERFMATLPPDQQKIFADEYNRLKRPGMAFQGPLSELPYIFNKK